MTKRLIISAIAYDALRSMRRVEGRRLSSGNYEVELPQQMIDKVKWYAKRETFSQTVERIMING